MKRKPKTPKPAAVRIGTEDQEPSRDYWEAEAKLAIRAIAEIGDENRQLRARIASQAQLIKELTDDNDREFAAGGRYVVGKAIEAAERWAQAAGKILGDCEIEPDVQRALKAVRFFAEGGDPAFGSGGCYANRIRREAELLRVMKAVERLRAGQGTVVRCIGESTWDVQRVAE